MSLNIVNFINKYQDNFQEALELLPIPIFVKSLDGKYISCNASYISISNKTRQQLIGKTVFDIWPKEQAEVFNLKDQELYDNPTKQVYEMEISSSFGKLCIVQFHKTVIFNGQGEAVGILGIIFDITEKKQLERKLTNLADTDYLTGMLNRRAGLKQLGKLLNQHKRNQKQLTIAFLDIDNFKGINDKFSHKVGDSVLESIQDITVQHMRDYDLVIRYGGDEFILCFVESSIQDISETIERIRKAFAKKTFNHEGKSLNATVSIGLASFPAHGSTVDELIHNSDQTMYLAKDLGGNGIKITEDI